MQVVLKDAVGIQRQAEVMGILMNMRGSQVKGRLFIQPIGYSTLQAGGYCEGDKLMRTGDRFHQRRRPGHPPHLHKRRSRSDGSAL